MMINGKLRDFVCHVIAKGQITLGDVRRLQRGYLPDGITNGEELEMLIPLNAKLVRADKAWAQWLLSVVADFVTNREACERSFEDGGGKWADRLLAASATKLGRRIARQIRRELSRPRAMQSEECIKSCDVQDPDPRKPDPDDCSLRINLGTDPALCDACKSLAPSRSDAQFCLTQLASHFLAVRSRRFQSMSALPPKADIGTQPRHVRFVPRQTLPRSCVKNPPACGPRFDDPVHICRVTA
jgi:hypothetical protein